MKAINLFRHLLAILALVGLVSGATLALPSPAKAHGAVARSVDVSATMPGMDCHQGKKQTVPDCKHFCPWASLCSPNFLPSNELASMTRTAAVHAYRSSLDEQLKKRTDPPQLRPPRV